MWGFETPTQRPVASCPKCEYSAPLDSTPRTWVCIQCRAKLRAEYPRAWFAVPLFFVGGVAAVVGGARGNGWCIGAGVMLVGVGVLIMPRRPTVVVVGPGPFCLACGYDLTGNTTGLCPECGIKPAPR